MMQSSLPKKMASFPCDCGGSCKYFESPSAPAPAPAASKPRLSASPKNHLKRFIKTKVGRAGQSLIKLSNQKPKQPSPPDRCAHKPSLPDHCANNLAILDPARHDLIRDWLDYSTQDTLGETKSRGLLSDSAMRLSSHNSLSFNSPSIDRISSSACQHVSTDTDSPISSMSTVAGSSISPMSDTSVSNPVLPTHSDRDTPNSVSDELAGHCAIHKLEGITETAETERVGSYTVEEVHAAQSESRPPSYSAGPFEMDAGEEHMAKTKKQFCNSCEQPLHYAEVYDLCPLCPRGYNSLCLQCAQNGECLQHGHFRQAVQNPLCQVKMPEPRPVTQTIESDSSGDNSSVRMRLLMQALPQPQKTHIDNSASTTARLQKEVAPEPVANLPESSRGVMHVTDESLRKRESILRREEANVQIRQAKLDIREQEMSLRSREFSVREWHTAVLSSLERTALDLANNRQIGSQFCPIKDGVHHHHSDRNPSREACSSQPQIMTCEAQSTASSDCDSIPIAENDDEDCDTFLTLSGVLADAEIATTRMRALNYRFNPSEVLSEYDYEGGSSSEETNSNPAKSKKYIRMHALGKRKESSSSQVTPPDKRSNKVGQKQFSNIGGGWGDLDDQSEDEDSLYPTKNKRENTESEPVRRLFVCPYARHDPERYSHHNNNPSEKKYRKCLSTPIEDISRLKQHLSRTHWRPRNHCGRCFEIFQDLASLEAHTTRLNACVPKDCPYQEKMDKLQQTKIHTKRPLAPLIDQWFDIYKTLFPNSPLPASPYITDLNTPLSPTRSTCNMMTDGAAGLLTSIFNERLDERQNEGILSPQQRSFVTEALLDTIRMMQNRPSPTQIPEEARGIALQRTVPPLLSSAAVTKSHQIAYGQSPRSQPQSPFSWRSKRPVRPALTDSTPADEKAVLQDFAASTYNEGPMIQFGSLCSSTEVNCASKSNARRVSPLKITPKRLKPALKVSPTPSHSYANCDYNPSPICLSQENSEVPCTPGGSASPATTLASKFDTPLSISNSANGPWCHKIDPVYQSNLMPSGKASNDHPPSHASSLQESICNSVRDVQEISDDSHLVSQWPFGTNMPLEQNQTSQQTMEDSQNRKHNSVRFVLATDQTTTNTPCNQIDNCKPLRNSLSISIADSGYSSGQADTIDTPPLPFKPLWDDDCHQTFFFNDDEEHVNDHKMCNEMYEFLQDYTTSLPTF